MPCYSVKSGAAAHPYSLEHSPACSWAVRDMGLKCPETGEELDSLCFSAEGMAWTPPKGMLENPKVGVQRKWMDLSWKVNKNLNLHVVEARCYMCRKILCRIFVVVTLANLSTVLIMVSMEIFIFSSRSLCSTHKLCQKHWHHYCQNYEGSCLPCLLHFQKWV